MSLSALLSIFFLVINVVNADVTQVRTLAHLTNLVTFDGLTVQVRINPTGPESATITAPTLQQLNRISTEVSGSELTIRKTGTVQID